MAQELHWRYLEQRLDGVRTVFVDIGHSLSGHHYSPRVEFLDVTWALAGVHTVATAYAQLMLACRWADQQHCSALHTVGGLGPAEDVAAGRTSGAEACPDAVDQVGKVQVQGAGLWVKVRDRGVLAVVGAEAGLDIVVALDVVG